MLLIWVSIYLLYYFSEYVISTNLQYGIKHKFEQQKQALQMASLKVLILALGWFYQFPLLILYLLVLFGYGVTFRSIYRVRQRSFIFWMNFFTILFIAVHLIVLACVSVFTGDMLRDVYLDKDTYLWTMCLVLGLLNLFNMIWKRREIIERVLFLTRDAKRFQQLILFQWYALGYLLFDSLACFFKLPYILLSVFLIGSCILLLIQLFLFMLHTYGILENAHYEAEYYRLEEERAEYVKRQMALRQLAYMDSLTGTFTRRYAMEMLESMQRDQLGVTVAYIDVNGLKAVNDTLGHLEGDCYLQLIANSLNQQLNKSDILARIGGDEFLIVSTSIAQDKLEHLLKKTNQSLSLASKNGYTPSFSYGVVSISGQEFLDLEKLLRESDCKMYAYKKAFKTGGLQ